MANRVISLPRHWEDWLGLGLGLWLCASPWVLRFAGEDMPATQNAFLIGVLLIAAETVILAAFRPWEEWITAAIGVWLVISPWVLGVVSTVALTNLVIVGLLVLGLALYEFWDVRHQTAHPA
jgi:hypothetical protein